MCCLRHPFQSRLYRCVRPTAPSLTMSLIVGPLGPFPYPLSSVGEASASSSHHSMSCSVHADFHIWTSCVLFWLAVFCFLEFYLGLSPVQTYPPTLKGRGGGGGGGGGIYTNGQSLGFSSALSKVRSKDLVFAGC